MNRINIWEQKFQELRRHPLYPFQKWRTNQKHYRFATLYWICLFKAVIGPKAHALWRPWHAADREREGNPIFSAVRIDWKRGVRVILDPGESRARFKKRRSYFQPFLSFTAAEPDDPNTMILELIWVSDISKKSERLCRKFWEQFCIARITEKTIEEEIGRYEQSAGFRW